MFKHHLNGDSDGESMFGDDEDNVDDSLDHRFGVSDENYSEQFHIVNVN